MEKSEKLEPKQIEEIYQEAMRLEETDDVEVMREISCKFYREGGCDRVYTSECKACMSEDSVRACKELYLAKIFNRPQTKWTPDFDKPLPREKRFSRKEIGNSVGIQCDTCYMADRCPLFKAGSECGIDWGEDIDVSQMKEKDIYETLVEIQLSRVRRMDTFEKVDGGMVDLNTSAEMDRLSRLLKEKADVGMTKFKATVSGSLPAGEDNKSAGILSKLFSKDEEKVEAPKEDEFIEYEEYEEEEENKSTKKDEASRKR